MYIQTLGNNNNCDHMCANVWLHCYKDKGVDCRG